LLFAGIVSIAAIFLEFFVVPQKQVMWFFGKFVNGIACSIFATTSSSYAIEVSPLQLRGVTTGAVNLYIVFGQLCVFYEVWFHCHC
jgi:MFS family permease